MPEYLAPGVYVEEVSFRAKSIEGVSTSTAGFVGPARYGPVSGEPELLTSFADFERVYGGLDDLSFGGTPRTNFLAHAVRAFFEEGGKRIYVSRIFGATNDAAGYGVASGVPASHYARFTPSGGNPAFTLLARFPGAAGNMVVAFTARVGANALATVGGARTLQRVSQYSVVSVRQLPAPADNSPAGAVGSADGLMIAIQDTITGAWSLNDGTASTALSDAAFGNVEVRPVTVLVEVTRPRGTPPVYGDPELLGEFGLDPRGAASLGQSFRRQPLSRFQALTIPFAIEPTGALAETVAALTLARAILPQSVRDELRRTTPGAAALRVAYTLGGGDDGDEPNLQDYEGRSTRVDYSGDPIQMPKNGLLCFEDLEDISIVAGPGYSATADATTRQGIHGALVTHAEKMRYRIAVLDTPRDQLPSQALDVRNQRSSKYAALYYPWVVVVDPLTGGRLALPPSGFVAGIYARNDVERAVFKAPANETVRLAIDFEQRINKAQQELLNPEGVNCFRFFEGRGYLLWGARTISDDPEWKYVNLRRYFAYLERSVDRGTQWAVFENNSRPLWDNVRRTVEDFLFNEWKQGALLGDKPEQAYFVRCDLSTMTQNDLDNGRLVCLVGVAPVRPAEFVIFRIGQWTASTPQ